LHLNTACGQISLLGTYLGVYWQGGRIPPTSVCLHFLPQEMYMYLSQNLESCLNVVSKYFATTDTGSTNMDLQIPIFFILISAVLPSTHPDQD